MKRPFKKGDIVFLAEDSEFNTNKELKGVRNNNPFNVKGVVEYVPTIQVNDLLEINVLWEDNEDSNCYSNKDLVHFEDKPISDYLLEIRKMAIKRKWHENGRPRYRWITKLDENIVIDTSLVKKYNKLLNEGEIEGQIKMWMTEMIKYCFLHGKGEIYFK